MNAAARTRTICVLIGAFACVIAVVAIRLHKEVEYPNEQIIKEAINARLSLVGGATDEMTRLALVTRVYNVVCLPISGGATCRWDQDSAGGYTFTRKEARFAKNRGGWEEMQ